MSAQDNSSAAQFSTATYSVVYTSTWSPATHPDGFPGNAHYSGLKGATHNASATFWELGTLASSGIQLMAETGNNSILDTEMDAEFLNGNVQFIINGSGLGTSPGSATVTFDISSSHPLFTMVSMLAPSPDWFIGINGLNLFEGNSWVDTLRVTAYTYDAGTDDGATYGADNMPSSPPVNVSRIEVSPFLYSGTVEPVGNFFFTLLSVLDNEPTLEDDFRVEDIYPNPFIDEANLSLYSTTLTEVTVDLFDLTGRKVSTLYTGSFVGSNDVRISGDGLATGIYYYRVQSANFVRSGSAILVK